MPIYGYECKNCDTTFEHYRSVREYRSPADCPICGHPADRTVSMVRRDSWRPIFLEHTSLEGNFFETKKELKTFLKETDQQAPGLID